LTHRTAIPSARKHAGHVCSLAALKRPFPVISRETVAFVFDLSGLGSNFA
jgi:hypothetical protein